MGCSDHLAQVLGFVGNELGEVGTLAPLKRILDLKNWQFFHTFIAGDRVFDVVIVTGAAMKAVLMPKAIATTAITTASKMNIRIEASSPNMGQCRGA
jgi:hypothetical protein